MTKKKYELLLVDDEPLAWEDEAGVLDRRLHALTAFLYRRVRQADDREGGQPARRVHFLFHNCPLQPHNSAGVDLGEQALRLG